MKRKSRYLMAMAFLALFFHLGSFSISANVEASESSTLTYEELQIYVMPQYTQPEEWESDEPAVIIGMYGTLVNGTDAPYSDDIQIPVHSDPSDFQFSRVGKLDDEGSIQDVEATFDDKSSTITWQLADALEPGDAYHFFIEYYFAPAWEDTSFQFSYVYELERKADQLNILLFEPYGAENFTVDTETDSGEEGVVFGIHAHVFDWEEAEEGTVFDASVRYEKEDNVTTLEALETLEEKARELSEISQENAVKESAEAEQTTMQVERIVFIAITIVIVGLFVYFIFKNRKAVKKKKKEEKKINEAAKDVDDELRALRRKLIRGEITKEDYEKERSKYVT